MIHRIALAVKPYVTAYYAFLAGIGVGIPIGALASAYAVKILIERFT
jgi:hypothetical protein